MTNVFMATAVDLGEAHSPCLGPHVRDKQDVGKRLALAYRDNFVEGDGPFFTPGAIATSATTRPGSKAHRGGSEGSIVEITLRNLPPGETPLLEPVSALGLEVSGEPASNRRTKNDTWYNATGVSLDSTNKGVLHVESALARVRQVRYLWASTPCLGWNSTTERREVEQEYRCPLVTSTGLPVLPFVLDVGLARSVSG
jgi:hypothetical protein